ncbi:hypothetical protein, partial [Pusillimonas noertemannii]|uniref:hypothetical protein n=1 Tax=Pusillimonas noertemannii TaxID=305977 RepID=UPI00058F79E3
LACLPKNKAPLGLLNVAQNTAPRRASQSLDLRHSRVSWIVALSFQHGFLAFKSWCLGACAMAFELLATTRLSVEVPYL